jgi:glycosyltransferase involved in cell wall biosynthesis
MMTEKPKVSVFIASYNHAKFLPECLDSILAQTFRDFEIVVVDDGSTDGSQEILTDYQQRFSEQFFYFWHPGHVNKGISASCNLALSKARGDYLAWIGSDDVWYPEKLSHQVSLLDANVSYGLVYSYAHYIDEDGSLLPGLMGEDITRDPNPLGRMLQYSHTPPLTLVFRRECLDDVGPFDETLVNSDRELLIRIFARWETGFNDLPLAKYRLHATNVSVGIDPKISLKRILAMYQTVQMKTAQIDGALLQPQNQALLSLQLALHYFCDDDVEEAIASLCKAFDEDPSLSDAPNYFINWLNSWKPDFYTTSHSHFGLWAIVHLPLHINNSFRNKLVELQFAHPDTKDFFIRRAIERDSVQSSPISELDIFYDWPNEIRLPSEWKNMVLGKIYSELLFRNYKNGNVLKTRYYWFKTIQHSPAWLKNRGIWSIGIKTIFRPSIVPDLNS